LGELGKRIQESSFVPLGYQRFDFNGKEVGRRVIDIKALQKIFDDLGIEY
jgi:hypothetical protein